MSDTVIRVENLSKLYRLGEVGTGSLAHDVNRWWHKVRGKEDPYLKIGEVNDRTKPASSVQSPESSAKNANALDPRRSSLDSSAPSLDSTPSSSSRPLDPGLSTPSSSALDSRPSTLVSPKAQAPSDWVYALKDVSFEVKRGEVLGIIGRNGAGKSTLLKILSRVTTQSSGQIKVRGRIASLLEVGTGFHPELTGRENIFLNGAILGMRKAEIARKFDEIVEFSGCARYIDTPVKRYSSGMYVRLAFAVAAHLEPEILIVDEVLAVGDAEFQKKCLGKMKDVAGHGRTVLFVSHNMTAVKSLCSRVVLMKNGLVLEDGPTETVAHAYQSLEFQETLHRTFEPPLGKEEFEKNGVYLKEARILFDQTQNDSLRVGTPFQIEFCIFSKKEQKEINLSPHYLGTGGEVIFAAPSPPWDVSAGENWFCCEIPGSFFNDGIYTIQLLIVKDSSAVQVVNEALIFEIHEEERRGNWFGKWPGVVRPKFEWNFRNSSQDATF